MTFPALFPPTVPEPPSTLRTLTVLFPVVLTNTGDQDIFLFPRTPETILFDFSLQGIFS